MKWLSLVAKNGKMIHLQVIQCLVGLVPSLYLSLFFDRNITV